MIKKVGCLFLAISTPMFLFVTGCGTHGSSNSTNTRKADSVENATSTPVSISKLNFTQTPHMWNLTQGWVVTSSTKLSKQGQKVFTSKLLVTNSGGKQWTNVTPKLQSLQGLQNQSGSFYNKSFGWFVALDPGRRFVVERTTDGGKTWKPSIAISTPYGDGGIQIDRLTKEQGYIAIDSAGMTNPQSVLYRTVDGGRTWVRLSNPPIGGEIHFVSPLDGWLTGVNNTPNAILKQTTGHTGRGYSWIYETENGGQSWKHIQLPIPASLSSDLTQVVSSVFRNQWAAIIVKFYDNSGASVQKLYESDDGGQNWSVYDLPHERVQEIQFVSNSVGYLETFVPGKSPSSPEIPQWFQTLNGGRTWQRLSTGLPSQVGVSIRFQSSNVWWALNNGALFQTQNTGRTWVKIHAMEIS